MFGEKSTVRDAFILVGLWLRNQFWPITNNWHFSMRICTVYLKWRIVAYICSTLSVHTNVHTYIHLSICKYICTSVHTHSMSVRLSVHTFIRQYYVCLYVCQNACTYGTFVLYICNCEHHTSVRLSIRMYVLTYKTIFSIHGNQSFWRQLLLWQKIFQPLI